MLYFENLGTKAIMPPSPFALAPSASSMEHQCDTQMQLGWALSQGNHELESLKVQSPPDGAPSGFNKSNDKWCRLTIMLASTCAYIGKGGLR